MAGMDLLGLTETQILTKAYFAWESKARPGRKSSEELHETVFTLGKGKLYCNGESSLVSSLLSHELSPPMAAESPTRLHGSPAPGGTNKESCFSAPLPHVCPGRVYLRSVIQTEPSSPTSRAGVGCIASASILTPCL